MDNNTEEIRREAEPERGTKPRDTVKTSERVSVPLGAESESHTVTGRHFRDSTDHSAEITLPDYYGNAEKLMFVRAVPRIEEVYTDGDEIKYTGSVKYTEVFLTDEGMLRSITTDSPLSGSAVCPRDGDGDVCISAIPLCSAASGRLTSPKSLSVKCTVVTDLMLTEQDPVEPTVRSSTEALTDGLTLQKRTDSIESLCIQSFTESGIRGSEDIELESGMPPIEELICCSVRIYPDECKLSGNEITLRSNAQINILCRGEGGAIMSMQKRIPITETFDSPECIEGRTDVSCFPILSLDTVSAEPADNSFGERRIIELDYTYSATVFCFYSCTVPVARDAYSTEYMTTPEFITRDTVRFSELKCGSVSIGDSAPIPNYTEGSHPEILYSDAAVCELSARLDPERGKLELSGRACVYLLLSGEKHPVPMTFDTPIKVELDGYGLEGRTEILATAAPRGVRARVDGSSVHVDFELDYLLAVFSRRDEEMIASLTVDETKPCIPADRPAMVLYYPKKGEMLWDIAKRYGTTVADIRSACGVQGDAVDGQHVIMLPRKKKCPVKA